MGIALAVVHLDVANTTILIPDGQQHRIDETFIRRKVELVITGQHLFVEQGGLSEKGRTYRG